MEILPYTIGVLMFAFVVYWSAANTPVAPGTPIFGLFRYREVERTLAVRPANRPGGRRPVRTGSAPPDSLRPDTLRPDARRRPPGR